MAPTNIKRRLRKTRRSLNEMRNRIYLAKNSKLKSSNMKHKNAILKHVISDNHFMLPNKMVRSEIITRTALHESKQICTNMLMVNNKYKYSCNKNTDIVECHSTETDSNTSNSVELFSPLQGLSKENEDSDYYDQVQDDETMQSSLHSKQELSENIFNQLMDGFHKQIKDTIPELLLTDFIDKKKQSIRNIFSDIDLSSPPELSIQMKTIENNPNMSEAYKGLTCQHMQKSYSENISSSAESIQSAVIYTSPTTKCQNVYDSLEQKPYSGNLSSSAESIQLAAIYISPTYKSQNGYDTPEQKEKAYSGNISSSAESIQSAAIYISPTYKCQNVYDSPEYSYYPHRLNY